MQISKKELRSGLLNKRRSMDKNVMKSLSDSIYNNLIELDIIKESDIILCYVSTDIETDTRKFINEMLRLGKKVYAPRCSGKIMEFFRIESLEELRIGAYNIPEPCGDDKLTDFCGSVCIVPALAFDLDGYRLGYGGGYYDRFLSDYNGTSVGICFSGFIVTVPKDEYDLPVDILVSDNKVVYLNH